MALTFPANCDTPAEKVRFCFRVHEKLRDLHNFFGRWWREGVTATEWNQLSLKIRNRYPYKPRITKEEWLTFQRVWMVKNQKVHDRLNENRQLMWEDTNYDNDIDMDDI